MKNEILGVRVYQGFGCESKQSNNWSLPVPWVRVQNETKKYSGLEYIRGLGVNQNKEVLGELECKRGFRVNQNKKCSGLGYQGFGCEIKQRSTQGLGASVVKM